MHMTGMLIKTQIMLFKICIYALHMANFMLLIFDLTFMVNPQNCCARRTILNNRTVISILCLTLLLWLILRIVVHGEPFLRTIEPLSARPFNFPKEFHLTEAEVNQNRYLLFLFCTLYCHFNFRLSFIGSRSE